jgi:hypothetical protein
MAGAAYGRLMSRHDKDIDPMPAWLSDLSFAPSQSQCLISNVDEDTAGFICATCTPAIAMYFVSPVYHIT